MVGFDAFDLGFTILGGFFFVKVFPAFTFFFAGVAFFLVTTVFFLALVLETFGFVDTPSLLLAFMLEEIQPSRLRETSFNSI